MIDLDDTESFDRVDSQGVLAAVERFGDQCREAWEIGRAVGDLPDAEGLETIVVLGMGGSGVSGDVTQCIVEPRLPIPFRVIKGYGPLPEWVARTSLVFAVSYSGDTEETVAALEEAHTRGCRAVTISSGGRLEEMAAESGIAHVSIPPGLQPRTSLGYLTMPILAVLVQMGLIPEMQDTVDDAIEVLSDLGDRCHRKKPIDENPAKALASRLLGKIPVIYGGMGVGGVAAQRFKCDLNEYGKVPAFYNVLPELDHNEIVGWKQLGATTGERFVLVTLREPNEHPRIAMRFDVTQELIRESFADAVEVRAEGTTVLAHILSLVMITQLASIYIALVAEIDPGPVDVITRLKDELAKR